MKFWCIMLLDKDWIPRYYFIHARDKKEAEESYHKADNTDGCDIVDIYEVEQK